MDRDAMAAAIRAFLDGLGEGAGDDELGRTPQRVAEAWTEDLVSGYTVDPDAELTWTSAPRGCGPVMVRDVEFASMCVHHLLPFFGRAALAYVPSERQAGLSKLGRVLDAHARRLQTQERLTGAVADTLERVLAPQAVLVLLEARHTCMTLRGVRKTDGRMVTVAARGLWERDAAERSTMLALMRGGAGAR